MMPTLLVFLKYPAPGRVKTRLAESLGPVAAANLYRQWIDLVFAQVQPLRGQISVVAYYTGADLPSFSSWHPLADQWWMQPEGELGTRLASGFEKAAQPTVAIGTDCLELDSSLLLEAFSGLGKYDAIFGPAQDGGYYLVGTSRHLTGFFTTIPWSSRHTLASHLSHCQRNGWSFSLLRERYDIDTLDDWQRHCTKAYTPS
jgi:rSAM/selenodomain-associated transferase 1